MKLELSHCPDVSMVKGAISRLHNATDIRLRCLSGSVWITVDGVYDDVVLEAGQSWVVPGPARVIAQAMEPSTLRFESTPDCARAPAARRPQREPAFA